MAKHYKEGQSEIRPGIYQRESSEAQEVIVTYDGRVAALVQADWGPVDEVQVIKTENDLKRAYGTGKTTDSILYALRGGAAEVYALRLGGKDGAKGTFSLTQSGGTDLKLELKYPGARKISIQIKDDLTLENVKNVSFFEDGVLLESFQIKAGEEEDEVANLVEVLNDSKLVTVSQIPEAHDKSTITLVPNKEAKGGKSPTVNNESYSEALTVLERYRFNCLIADTVDEEVQTLFKEYVAELFENGRYTFYVTAAKDTDLFNERIKKAQGFNDCHTVMIGNGYVDANDNKVTEYLMAAQLAGMIASISSKNAITGKQVSGAVSLSEGFSNEQYKAAVKNGMILLDFNELDQIVFDSGVTTLSDLAEDQDRGYTKIKRVKTRNEMYYRISMALEPSRGNTAPINTNIAFIKTVILGVLKDMFDEEKIAEDYDVVQTDEFDGPDEISFEVTAYDYDSIEKIYLHYIHREKI